MLRVALTGGIATGKSYVLGLMRDRSIPTIDADQVAHAVVAPGEPAHQAIRTRFGPEVVHADGTLDRTRLGAIVFNDAAARADLEQIVHPRVRTAIDGWFRTLAAAAAPRFAVADIPLLYETGRDGEFDRVIVVACAPETQVARVVARDGLTEAEARQRLAAQLPIADKTARTRLVITTDGSFDETRRQVDDICGVLAAVPEDRPH